MSLNWSTVKSLAIPVGGTARDVKRVSIGGSVVWEKPNPLPYDAEVEYLESTGTQYIATGVYTTGPMTFRLSATFTPVTAERDFFGAWRSLTNGSTVCGVYNKFVFGYNYPNTRIDSATLGSAEMYADIEYVVGASSRTLTVNGTQYSQSGATFNSELEVAVFRANVSAYGQLKLHAFKILDAQGNLVRDFIPVRKGTTGYLYDRVSGQLFGNAGTGAFGYGGDLNAHLYDDSALVANWDALENVGYGTHDASAARWIDLIGNREATLGSACAWGDDCLYTKNNNATWTGAFFQQASPITIEAVFDTDFVQAGNFASPLSASTDNLSIFSRDGTKWELKFVDIGPNTRPQVSRASKPLFVRLDGSGGKIGLGYMDNPSGASKLSTTTTSVNPNYSWNIGGNNVGGANRLLGINAKYYALRVYSRALSDAEITRHAMIDRRRFGVGG